VLAVWIGNFDGQGNPAFIGVDAAAPLFFRIIDALNFERQNDEVPSVLPPPGVAKVTVCAGSGDLPNVDCPHTEETWYAAPLRSVSYTLHRANAQDVVALEASVAADVRNVFWFDGTSLIGQQPVSEGAMPWRPSNDGIHLLRVIDDHGRAAERDVEVRFVQ
jgi:membrane carboxypeptidase/penicillin-binding protein PbpC